MGEKNNGSNKGGIFLIILLLLLIIICIFWYITSNNGNEDKEIVKLNYDIVSNNDSSKTIVVNDKNTGISGDSITNVNKLQDALIFMVSDKGSGSIYIVDEKGNTLNKIVGSSIQNESSYISAKGSIISDNYKIDNDNITVVSNSLGQDPVSTICPLDDEDIVKYTEQFTYLGNGKFSNSEVIDSVSVKEYKKTENIICE